VVVFDASRATYKLIVANVPISMANQSRAIEWATPECIKNDPLATAAIRANRLEHRLPEELTKRVAGQ
jgi:hypothetical protein